MEKHLFAIKHLHRLYRGVELDINACAPLALGGVRRRTAEFAPSRRRVGRYCERCCDQASGCASSTVGRRRLGIVVVLGGVVFLFDAGIQDACRARRPDSS